MATIPYLNGGEPATAERMNAVFDELDRKLSLLLNGRSFLIAFTGPVQPVLTGKPFVFSAGVEPSAHAWKVSGVVSDLQPDQTRRVRSYNHAQFATANTVVTAVDEALAVMTIATIATAQYAGIPERAAVGYFEHSLSVHTRTGTGQGGLTGTAGRRYFLKEARMAAPEKFYDYAVAEVLLEGVADVNLPGDKYCFFRIHNLNPHPATVRWGGDYSLNLAPFECRTVRRTRVVTPDSVSFSNYRTGGHYFWKFEGGDPRFHWFFATSRIGGNVFNSKLDDNVSNSMTASNLANPAVLYDWILHLTPTPAEEAAFDFQSSLDLAALTRIMAYWKRDPHVLADAYPNNDGLFGDPADPATPLGDLLHHRGRIIIAKVHRTQKQEPPNQSWPRVEFDEVTFNGYRTIATDFAAKGLVVRERADGNLEVTANDADWEIDLIPVGTNLFKPWVPGDTSPLTGTGIDSLPTAVLDIQATPRIIESAIFETQQIEGTTVHGFSNVAPALVFPRAVTQTPNQRTYQRRLGTPPDQGGYPAVENVTVTGEPVLTLVQQTVRDNVKTGKVLRGIHRVTVADLLKLDWWGDETLATQETDYVKFSDRRLTLTPQGPVLTYNERVPAYPLPELPFSFYSDRFYPQPNTARYTLDGSGAGGFYEIRRAIRFRGHGWGYQEGGGVTSLCFVPQYGRAEVLPLEGEVIAPDGRDFILRNLEPRETGVKVLRRVRPENLVLGGGLNNRFWKLDGRALGSLGNMDGLVAVDRNTSALFYAQRRTLLQNSPLAWSGGALVSAPLAAEHYNMMAGAVNSLTRGHPLHYAAHLFWVPALGRHVRIKTALTGRPLPIDLFSVIQDGIFHDTEQEALMASIGVPVRTEQDIDDVRNLGDAPNLRHEIITKTEAELVGMIEIPDVGTESTIFMKVSARASQSAPAVYEPGVVYSGGGGGFTLKTALRWTRIEDVQDRLRSFGIELSLVHVFEPLIVEVVDKGEQPELHPGSVDELIVKRLNNVGGASVMAAIAAAFPAEREQTELRVIRQMILRPTEPEESPTWKRFPVELTGAYGPLIIRRASAQRTQVAEVWNRQAGVSISIRFGAGGPFAAANLAASSKKAIGLAFGSAEGPYIGGSFSPVTDAYLRWGRSNLNDEKSLAVLCVGPSPATEVRMCPVSSWATEKDWWTHSIDGYFFADNPLNQLGYFIAGPQSYVPPGAARTVSCPEGITLIRAEEDSAYKCLFDSSSLTDLT